ncbi:single-stranded-DNA-specific exonuclease RecJ [Propionispora vibrioides]|uniref:Single-stranded-DNA-specific exonuclease RecJ n=1 Tax=Propionispora vibrioides TaxID=112903 RepID=A0A1H8NWG3_9FIRM|nr:single-stranded-DNA-specific exonuclease RecJ [Propionispora vibrioides]SEO33970.1 single-stranded-DNA-specific exonuclease RecJ [Propionispora vibrioides]
MSRICRRWNPVQPRPDIQSRLSAALGISRITAQILLNRGLDNIEEAKAFLYGAKEALHDPQQLEDMDRAVQRIKAALDNKQKITIYGDYDVDGITATALFYRTLRQLGGEVGYYIPDRQSEGYGVHAAALERLYEQGAGLIVTVDCGISAAAEIAGIQERVDIIVTDHHQPPEKLPPAYAVINPKRPDCGYPEKQLAGVGVAYKVCQSLWCHYQGKDSLLNCLDLVALGTVADVVSLLGENRILVKAGLAEMAKGTNTGLRALMNTCKLLPEQLEADKIGFVLAPRINAAGRVGKADLAVELLITEDEVRAQEIAALLENENTVRKNIEKQILEEAGQAAGQCSDQVMVLAGQWHPGIIGIVASRLVDVYYRPVVMIALQDGQGRGSCRSVAGFDIYLALMQCADLLLHFGGHSQAAGFSILPENLEAFRQRLNDIAGKVLPPEALIPELQIDALVSLTEVDFSLVEELKRLAPYGMGNAAPLLACENLEVSQARAIGQEGRHLKMRVQQKKCGSDVIAWQLGSLAPVIGNGGRVDVAFVPEINEWNGARNLQLKALDVRPAVKEKENHAIIKSSNHHLELHDYRNVVNKLEHILTVLATGEKTVIYVNTAVQAGELIGQLTLAADGRFAVDWYSQQCTAERRGMIESRWQSRELQAIVLVPNACVDITLPAVRHVVFYHAALNKKEFSEQCSKLERDADSFRLHLVFGKNDIGQTGSFLKSSLPDRAITGYVYLLLRSETEQDRPVDITAQTIKEMIFKKYNIVITEDGVAAALQILTELKLLEVLNGQDGCWRLALSKPPGHKLDIEQSLTFRAGQAKLEEFSRFARQLMEATAGEILTWIA